MTDRDWIILCWRLMIEFVRAYGKKHGLCDDLRITKAGSPVTPEQVDYLNASM